MGLRNLLTRFGLIGIIGLVGCEMTPEEQRRAEERTIEYIIGTNAITNRNLTLQQGAVVGYTAQMIRDYNVAKEGKDNQVIVIQQPQQDYVSDEERKAFMENFWKENERKENERKAFMDRIYKKYGIEPSKE